ncbi:MAG: replication restart helicase PriA, partial [Chitinophagales bacterium]
QSQNQATISTKYAHIILPLAVANEYTYRVPTHLLQDVVVGKRVEVQFGKKRTYAGIVKTIFEPVKALEFKTKDIINVLDAAPILTSKQLQLWAWIATYYMCTEGEVLTAALPSAFKLSSETNLSLNPAFSHDYSLLSDREYLITEALTIQKDINIADAQNILQIKNIFPIVKSLLEKGVILVKEELLERYKPKMARFIQLAADFSGEEGMLKAFEQIGTRAIKQQALLMAYYQLSQQQEDPWIAKKQLVTKANAAGQQVKSLVKKGIFEEKEQVVSRLALHEVTDTVWYELSEQQEKALQEVQTAFEKKSVVLLKGITSSGKTQIYIKLIEEVIQRGQQVLYLLPEIALSAQMIARLRQVFGQDIGIYHSKFNAEERIEIWQKVLHGEYKVVIGARSALFLPFQDLGLVVVDEEHDPSFKQFDPAPRYHARDAAIYLAYLYKAKVILGSATPSLESYHNATKLKKYGLVELNQRFGGVKPPRIEVVNLQEARKAKQMKSHFSIKLINELRKALEQGEQAIIFQNRRGYSPYLICNTCEWIPLCHQCDVSLTYHKHANHLRCHYCGYTRKPISKCESCKSTDVQIRGFGTEKIEDELQIFFPDAKIGRLDLDTARSKKGFERVITAFEKKELHILVGTQMITKGLDFDNVSIVGVISVDQLLSFPDFRATERAYQLILQVSGRAGRRQKQGQVLLQTSKPEHPIIHHILYGSYLGFFRSEALERINHQYPPFVRLIQVTLKHKVSTKVNEGAFILARALTLVLKKAVLGPTVPIVSRVRNYYLRTILVKLPKSAKTTQE